jgi:hypothetical protein
LKIFQSEGDFKAFNAAIRDFFTSPEVGGIFTDGYDGTIGSPFYRFRFSR